MDCHQIRRGIDPVFVSPSAELYSDYNPFWYHYTREEQSRAEGAQRRRKRLADEPACLPPPQLPPFTPEFRAARNIAVCPALLDVLLTVLQRCGCGGYRDGLGREPTRERGDRDDGTLE